MTLYIPFGKECMPATILTKGNLNRLPMPFDSVLTTPTSLKYILDTDFEDYLNLDYLTPIDKGDKIVTSHSKYVIDLPPYPVKFGTLPTDVFFNHHNLFDTRTYEWYKAKINNFRSAISSNQTLVMLSSIDSDNLISHGLYNYFNRSAKTIYVTCNWNDSEDSYILPSIKNDIIHIEIYSSDKFADQKSFDLTCQYLQLLFGNGD